VRTLCLPRRPPPQPFAHAPLPVPSSSHPPHSVLVCHLTRRFSTALCPPLSLPPCLARPDPSAGHRCRLHQLSPTSGPRWL
jgi:hypothetical protein